MNYAPILIPTLCRYEHFVRCIESLKKNGWAKYTDVFIALDYPKNEKHKEGYSKILEYLEGNFEEFNSFNIIKREYNFGSARNMRELRKLVFEKYDRYIRTDDDAEFSPNFLEYMNKCLEKYENDESVLAVTGYCYPIKLKVDKNSSVFKTNMIFPMWGTGFWKNKTIKLENKLNSSYIRKYLRNHKMKKNKMSIARYVDCLNGLTDFDSGLIDCFSDVACGIYSQLNDQYIIMPTISKVRNHGFDGSGEYCQNVNIIQGDKFTAYNYEYSKQPIDENINFILKEDVSFDNKGNMEILNEFDYRSKKVIKKEEIKFYIMKILGEPLYKKLWIMRNK